MITLREATIEDKDDIYHWRNDPVTRKQSFNTREIPYQEHCQWFNKALESPDKLFYIGIDDKNEKCGVVRFDLQGEFSAEISVNVPASNRGRGIGSQLIGQSCALFFSKTKRKFVIARIKEKNTASIKAFQKAGFLELFGYNDTTEGKVVSLILLVSKKEK
ncbi:MAG: GNAT family N-acetyltransferase [bacterium]